MIPISDHRADDLWEFVIAVYEEAHVDFFNCEFNNYSPEAKIERSKS